MANIGSFKKVGNEFQGEIVTLSVQARNVRIVPEANRTADNAPSHRVFVGRAEIGAAWSKRSNEGRDYLGLKLDDPSFNAPIYANLFDDEDAETFTLIWYRSRKANGDCGKIDDNAPSGLSGRGFRFRFRFWLRLCFLGFRGLGLFCCFRSGFGFQFFLGLLGFCRLSHLMEAFTFFLSLLFDVHLLIVFHPDLVCNFNIDQSHRALGHHTHIGEMFSQCHGADLQFLGKFMYSYLHYCYSTLSRQRNTSASCT